MYSSPWCPRTNAASSPWGSQLAVGAQECLLTLVVQACRPHPPGPLLLARRRGELYCGGTPPRPPSRASPLQPILDIRRWLGVFVNNARSRRNRTQTEQALLILNTYALDTFDAVHLGWRPTVCLTRLYYSRRHASRLNKLPIRIRARLSRQSSPDSILPDSVPHVERHPQHRHRAADSTAPADVRTDFLTGRSVALSEPGSFERIATDAGVPCRSAPRTDPSYGHWVHTHGGWHDLDGVRQRLHCTAVWQWWL